MFSPRWRPYSSPHGGDLILAVAAGDAVAEFGMYPQAVLVFGEDVVEQELLPLLAVRPVVL